jgi:hypothetical protein
MPAALPLTAPALGHRRRDGPAHDRTDGSTQTGGMAPTQNGLSVDGGAERGQRRPEAGAERRDGQDHDGGSRRLTAAISASACAGVSAVSTPPSLDGPLLTFT